MLNVSWCLGWPFWTLAVLSSLFYAWKCFDIFTEGQPTKPWAWTLHQRWFNGLGSFAGWVAMYFLLQKVSSCPSGGCATQLTLGDAGSFFFAFVGVTGYLPYTAMLVMNAIKDVVLKSLGLLK